MFEHFDEKKLREKERRQERRGKRSASSGETREGKPKGEGERERGKILVSSSNNVQRCNPHPHYIADVSTTKQDPHDLRLSRCLSIRKPAFTLARFLLVSSPTSHCPSLNSSSRKIKSRTTLDRGSSTQLRIYSSPKNKPTIERST